MTLDQRIEQKIKEDMAGFEAMPGVVIIHYLNPSSVLYMSSAGLKILGVELKELQDMGTEYYERYFNKDDAEEYVPKVLGMLERNDDKETISFFQQVRANESEPWQWYLSGTRIFMHDDEGRPYLTITVAVPVDNKHYFTNKIERLLQESEYLRNNQALLQSLTRRERQIVALVVNNKSSSEIAEELFVSEETIKTHRRNIKKKLSLKTSYETLKFAQSFDLV